MAEGFDSLLCDKSRLPCIAPLGRELVVHVIALTLSQPTQAPSHTLDCACDAKAVGTRRRPFGREDLARCRRARWEQFAGGCHAQTRRVRSAGLPFFDIRPCRSLPTRMSLRVHFVVAGKRRDDLEARGKWRRCGRTLDRFAQLQKKAGSRTGNDCPIATIQEAGLDGFWIDRVRKANG